MRFSNLFSFRKRRNRIRREGDKTKEGTDSGREWTSETGEVSEMKGTEKEASERSWSGIESPPDDDCCPICFGNFTIPFRAPCGHWYCGDCILQYWNHGAALKPCKCPMCSRLITKLIAEASVARCQDVEVLQNVRKYNRVFVGGTYGLILLFESPFLIKRIFHEMMDPDATNNHLLKILLGALYSVCHFDFLPAGRMDVVNFFDSFAIALVLVLYMIGLYRRWRQLRLVRLAVAHP